MLVSYAKVWRIAFLAKPASGVKKVDKYKIGDKICGLYSVTYASHAQASAALEDLIKQNLDSELTALEMLDYEDGDETEYTEEQMLARAEDSLRGFFLIANIQAAGVAGKAKA